MIAEEGPLRTIPRSFKNTSEYSINARIAEINAYKVFREKPQVKELLETYDDGI